MDRDQVMHIQPKYRHLRTWELILKFLGAQHSSSAKSKSTPNTGNTLATHRKRITDLDTLLTPVLPAETFPNC